MCAHRRLLPTLNSGEGEVLDSGWCHTIPTLLLLYKEEGVHTMVRGAVMLATVVCVAVALEEMVWEFGEYNPSNEYSNIHISGDISLFSKNTVIKLPAGSHDGCGGIDHLSLAVNNTFSTPKVTFKKRTGTLTIGYKLLQISSSSYRIDALQRICPYSNRTTGLTKQT